MHHAHRIYRNSSLDWSEALQQAWQIFYCQRYMKQGPVKFYYRKKDGETRCAFGTLKIIGWNFKNKPVSEHFDRVRYFDLERDAFRCFKPENFIYMSKTWKR